MKPPVPSSAKEFDALEQLSHQKQNKNSVDKFWAKVDKNGPIVREQLGPCWIWTGWQTSDGYGQVSWANKKLRAHRVAYSIVYGRVPAGMLVRHKCDTPMCCNPEHMELGLPRDNTRDMHQRGRKGRAARGTENHNAKLNDDLVRELREAWRNGESMKSIGQRMGMSQGAIHPMLIGKNWKHVV